MAPRHLAWFFPAIFLLPHAVLIAGFFEGYQENFFGVSSLKDALEITYYIVTVYAAFYAVVSYQYWKESHQSSWDKDFKQRTQGDVADLGRVCRNIYLSIHELESYVGNCKSMIIRQSEPLAVPDLKLEELDCLNRINLSDRGRASSISATFQEKLDALEKTAIDARSKLNSSFNYLKTNDCSSVEILECADEMLSESFECTEAFKSAINGVSNYVVM